MNWKDAAGALKKISIPAATALGGPAGTVAATIIAGALGSEKTPQAIVEAVKADPQAALKIAEIEADLAKLSMLDIQDARRAHGTHWVVIVLTFINVGLFAGAGVLLLLNDIPVPNRDLVIFMVGQLAGFASAPQGFWFGTTLGSLRKQNTLDQISKRD